MSATVADANDTITAIATPPGRSGIAIVRISGPLCLKIANTLTGKTPEPRQATHCLFRDSNGEAIEEGILIYFQSPASFTGEDMLELHGHGGAIVPALLLKQVIGLGARLAAPGEFSERAFLNGKIDLLQAEAIADLIDSSTERAARSAMRSLEGHFSKKVDLLLQDLIRLRVFVEGALDFPDEEIDFLEEDNIIHKVRGCIDEIDNMLDKMKRGRVLREGINLVIVGRPNVGKSSLLNQLVQAERAIVTETPGTTRDLIEEQIQLEGITVNIIDTAGIRAAEDEAEKEGVRRALSAVEAADIVLLVRETGEQPEDESVVPEKSFADKIVLVVNNKIDLAGIGPEVKTGGHGRTEVYVSAKTGEGLNLLVQQLQQQFVEETSGEDIILARARHINTLAEIRRHLNEGLEKYRNHKSAELLADELRRAQESLGTITGKFVPDDLLQEIFSRFCIGK